MGTTVGTSVEDSPTIGDILSTSMPTISGLFGIIVFCFFGARSSSCGSEVLFSTVIGLAAIGLGGRAATSASLI